MKTFKTILILLAFTWLFQGCDKDDPKPPVDEKLPTIQKLTTTQKVNIFIKNTMSDVYLWAEKLPNIDEKAEENSKEYFKKLLYVDDKWSFITDDIQALENSFEGVVKSFGWSLAFGRFSNTNNIFALVEYVYPNTPAANAGIKRGDIIIKIDGSDITDNNYRDLLNKETLSINRGVLGDDGISLGNQVHLTAKELKLNPVVFTKIIEHGGHKIGYLFYAQYIANYNESLDTAFQHFMNEQVTDLVLDLRYNPGGGTNAAQHLCSSIAPTDAVNAERTLVTFRWNKKYQTHWENKNANQQLKVNFDNNIPHKMGLHNLYVLTGKGTASASELTITGLKPYMNVKTIGETTYGKYTASITIKPKNLYDSKKYYEEFNNWGLQPIVLRYANSQGVTDFKNGFTPDIKVKEDLFKALPLGNKEEQLLKVALKEITGVEVISMTMKSAVQKPSYSIFDRGFSKFDSNKRELLLDHFDKTLIK
jgi:C-terminal processing protease CtpA/Prc